ncbi:MAG: DUF4390 domain-containing protein [Desulforhopalus sp.]
MPKSYLKEDCRLQASISKMMNKSFLLYLLFCLMVVLPASVAAKVAPERKATITELTATTSESHLIVFGTLENSFTDEMIEILHSGIPIRFSFFIELYKTSENWPKERMVTYNFHHVMTYDTLKEQYRVTLEEDNNRVLSFKSLPEAQKVINEINGAKVCELEQLVPDSSYLLQVRAELHKKTLPMSLQSVFPFLSWWDNETEWYSIAFKY